MVKEVVRVMLVRDLYTAVTVNTGAAVLPTDGIGEGRTLGEAEGLVLGVTLGEAVGWIEGTALGFRVG